MSPDFLASDQCDEEMAWAIQRMEASEVSVIPVLIRPTASGQETPEGDIEPLPADRKPIGNRADREEAMRNIAEHVQYVSQEIRQGFTEIP